MNAIAIVNQALTAEVLQDKDAILRIVEAAYQAHGRCPGQTPLSHFLRFPDRAEDRIIALLSRYASGEFDLAGIKWVSSFPGNISNGRPRAFASIILNDMRTGYPVALISASPINAARTAASAALAARAAYRIRGIRPSSIGLIGAGHIGTTILDYLRHVGLEGSVVVHDRDSTRIMELSRTFGRVSSGTLDTVLGADLIIFATTAVEPFVSCRFRPDQIILHISLRDLAPTAISHAQNIVDDPDHAVRERTSLEITRDREGHIDFITGTITELLAQAVVLDERPIIISPFGLGILDIAVATHVLQRADESAESVEFY